MAGFGRLTLLGGRGIFPLELHLNHVAHLGRTVHRLHAHVHAPQVLQRPLHFLFVHLGRFVGHPQGLVIPQVHLGFQRNLDFHHQRFPGNDLFDPSGQRGLHLGLFQDLAVVIVQKGFQQLLPYSCFAKVANHHSVRGLAGTKAGHARLLGELAGHFALGPLHGFGREFHHQFGVMGRQDFLGDLEHAPSSTDMSGDKRLVIIPRSSRSRTEDGIWAGFFTVLTEG